MGEIRVYRGRTSYPKFLANGKLKYYANRNARVYECKLHHPDASEIEAIRAEIESGVPKKEVAIRHDLKTVYRLNNLLRRHPAPVTPRCGGGRAYLNDAEVEAVLAEFGWA